MFVQISEAMKPQLLLWQSAEYNFKNHSRIYRIELRGERAQDAGGPFRESISHMCQDLQSDAFDLLIQPPNAMYSIGGIKGQYIPNPNKTDDESMSHLVFLGFLMGMAVISHAPLPLDLPKFFFKKLGGETVTEADYRELDPLSWLESLETAQGA